MHTAIESRRSIRHNSLHEDSKTGSEIATQKIITSKAAEIDKISDKCSKLKVVDMPAVIHVLLHENTNASQSGALSILRLQAWSRGHIGGVGYHRILLPDQFSTRVAIAGASRPLCTAFK